MKKYKNLKAFCERPFSHIKIDVKGDVSMCCYQGSLGNILENSIEDIWNNDLSKEIRKYTLENKLHPWCKSWGACPHINKDLTKNHMEFPYEESLPISIEIDLPSRHCNIGGENPNEKNPACIMCPRDFEKFRSTDKWNMNNTAKIAESLKVLMPRLYRLSVLGVAEPFWRNAVFDILDILEYKKYKKEILFWTFTNGSLFNDKCQDKFLEYTHRSQINCSLDAGTKETYIKIRRRDFFDTIVKNLVIYSSKRTDLQRLEIHNNINKMNVNEMHLMVDTAKEVWADEIYFNITHDAAGYSECHDIMIKEEDHNLFKENEIRAKERAKELGIEIRMYRTFEQVFQNKINKEDNLVQIKI